MPTPPNLSKTCMSPPRRATSRATGEEVTEKGGGTREPSVARTMPPVRNAGSLPFSSSTPKTKVHPFPCDTGPGPQELTSCHKDAPHASCRSVEKQQNR